MNNSLLTFLHLCSYATEADVELVRKAVRSIGRCAIKLEAAAEQCIHVLLQLIQNPFNPVVQESIIVIKVCRNSPSRFNFYGFLIICDFIGYLP